MIGLSVDTTGRNCTAALVDGGRILASRSDAIGRGHDAHLAPMVADMLKTTKLTVADVSRIAVCTGPGSFTGQRVGLSFAVGLALPRHIPVLGFSCFDVWAAEGDAHGVKNILTVADVRRGQLCWAYYEKAVLIRGPQTDEHASAEAIFQTLPAHERLDDKPISGPILAWLGLDRDPKNYPATPLYSRPPDAKLPGGKTLPPS